MMRLELACPPPTSRAAAEDVARRAEAAGLRALWLYDVPLVWMDPFPLLGAMAGVTSSLHLGPCVSNPVNRPPIELGLQAATMQRLSEGRLELALGRGDAAVRRLGRQPASLDTLRAAVEAVRSVTLPGGEYHQPWMGDAPAPLWIGTYGPRGLRMAGEIADGVVLQFADPELVAWAIKLVHEGALRADRDPQDVQVMAASALWVADDEDEAATRCQWFTDMIGDDMARILAGPDAASLSSELHEWAASWRAADTAARRVLAKAMTPRLSIVGPLTACAERLIHLELLGVDSFNAFALNDVPGVLEGCAALL
jgi:alkanesulfonate monooxygenase SsuD/methylene tetrahydromethanopterin reductase-like flavin-dependent oxidoreductase (luciferase family)